MRALAGAGALQTSTKAGERQRRGDSRAADEHTAEAKSETATSAAKANPWVTTKAAAAPAPKIEPGETAAMTMVAPAMAAARAWGSSGRGGYDNGRAGVESDYRGSDSESADASDGHMGKANDNKDNGGASNRAPNLMAPKLGGFSGKTKLSGYTTLFGTRE